MKNRNIILPKFYKYVDVKTQNTIKLFMSDNNLKNINWYYTYMDKFIQEVKQSQHDFNIKLNKMFKSYDKYMER